MRQVRQTATKQKEKEQKKSKPLARSLQEDYSGSEEKKDEHMQESEEESSQAAIVNTVATNPNTRQTDKTPRVWRPSVASGKGKMTPLTGWRRPPQSGKEDSNPPWQRSHRQYKKKPQWGERGRQNWGTFTTTRERNSQPERTDCRKRLQDRNSAKTNSLPIAQELKKRRRRSRNACNNLWLAQGSHAWRQKTQCQMVDWPVRSERWKPDHDIHRQKRKTLKLRTASLQQPRVARPIHIPLVQAHTQTTPYTALLWPSSPKKHKRQTHRASAILTRKDDEKCFHQGRKGST